MAGGVELGVHAAFGAADQAAEPSHLINPQARCRAVCLEVGRIDHDGLQASACGSQPFHHLEEDALLFPALLPVVQHPLDYARDRLVWVVVLKRIATAQPVTVDKNDAA